MPRMTSIPFPPGKEASCVLLKYESNRISESYFGRLFTGALSGIYYYISLEPGRQHLAHSNNVIEVDFIKKLFIKTKAGLVDWIMEFNSSYLSLSIYPFSSSLWMKCTSLPLIFGLGHMTFGQCHVGGSESMPVPKLRPKEESHDFVCSWEPLPPPWEKHAYWSKEDERHGEQSCSNYSIDVQWGA